MKLTNQFELYSRGTYSVNLVDNVLVAFNKSTQKYVILNLIENDVKPACTPQPLVRREEKPDGTIENSRLVWVKREIVFCGPKT
eukprot:UN17302